MQTPNTLDKLLKLSNNTFKILIKNNSQSREAKVAARLIDAVVTLREEGGHY